LKIEEIRELLASKTVRLWSLQELGAWELAQQRGELRADGRRAFVEFRPAYKWLIEQMNRRIPNYPGCYPVWAWAEKPDMRLRYHFPTGTACVRIHFGLPREQVLFSCFSSWHCVLQGDYLAKNEHADRCFEAFCRRTRAEIFLFGSLEADVLVRARIKRSWQHIFDFEWLAQNPEWHGEELFPQATTAVVPLNSIISTEHFVAR
jgi:hypothetical protein